MPAITNPNASQLDQTQILQRAFDEATDRLRTDAQASVTVVGDITVEIDAADGDNIALSNADGSKKVSVTTVSAKNGLDTNILDGSIKVTNTLITVPFDYITASYPSATTEVYVYKTGGASGTIVGVITVAYSDSTKAVLLTVAKT
jgi:hypothetical protein